MYDSYDTAQSDAETVTINQGASDQIDWSSNNQTPSHISQGLELAVTTNGSAPVAGDFAITYTDGSGWITIDSIQPSTEPSLHSVIISLTENSSGANRTATITVTHSGGSPTDDITITQSFGYTSSVHTVDIYKNTSCGSFDSWGSQYRKNVVYNGDSFTIYAKSPSTLDPLIAEVPTGGWPIWTSSYDQVPSVVAGLATSQSEDLIEAQLSAPLSPASLTCGGTGTPYQVTIEKNYSRAQRIIDYKFYYQDADGIVNNTGTPDAQLRIFQEGNHASWFHNVDSSTSEPTSLLPFAEPGEEPNLCAGISVAALGESVTIQYKTEIGEVTPPTFKWFEIDDLTAGTTYNWNTLWGGATSINVSGGTGLPSYVSSVSRIHNAANGTGSITLVFDAHSTGTDIYRAIRLGITHPDITSTRPDHEVEIKQFNSTL